MNTKRNALIFIFATILQLLLIYAVNSYLIKSVDFPVTFEQDSATISRLFKTNTHKQLDILFIGDSRTKYQVDSKKIANQLNAKVFNAGLNGYRYFFWPTLINKINASHDTRLIILSLDLSVFYEPFDFVDMEKSIHNYARFTSVPFLYSAKINARETSTFIVSSINNILDFRAIGFALENLVHHRETANCQSEGETAIENVYDCQDNTGYLLVKKVPSYNNLSISYQDNNLNKTALRFVTNLVKDIQSRNTRVALILLPVYGNHYNFSFSKLQNRLNTPILDLTDFLNKPQDNIYWADGSHLNIKGRNLFTTKLISWLNVNQSLFKH